MEILNIHTNRCFQNIEQAALTDDIIIINACNDNGTRVSWRGRVLKIAPQAVYIMPEGTITLRRIEFSSIVSVIFE